MTRTRAVALACGCALFSVLALAWSSNSLLIAGSTPATIWAPALPLLGVAAVLLPLAALVAASGPKRRWAAFSVWLVALALLTHRIVDGGPDGLKDLWLGLPVVTLTPYAETDAAPHACRLARLSALCLDRGGRPYRLLTAVPFRPLR